MSGVGKEERAGGGAGEKQRDEWLDSASESLVAPQLGSLVIDFGKRVLSFTPHPPIFLPALQTYRLHLRVEKPIDAKELAHSGVSA